MEDPQAMEVITQKTLKRKRASLLLSSDQKATQIEILSKEMEGLFGYYGEVMSAKDGFGLDLDLSCSSGNDNNNTLNGVVALLMEESELALSKLVEAICGKLNCNSKFENVTLATVKSAVLFVGQRITYGVPNTDADVLEDDSPSSLWCWEARDLKLMPHHVRGQLKIRRLCRKKIHDRIVAVSAMLAALQRAETDQECSNEVTKALEKLNKVSQEADIRLLVNGMQEKIGAEMADKKAKREEKLLIKQEEKSKRECEKEKKRMELELQKAKKQTEREQKRLQEEEEKEQKRREKEESEMKKQLKKQQEEAEKERRLKEKEEAELKKQIATRKQASIMEQFLKRSKANSPCTNDETLLKATTPNLSNKQTLAIPDSVTLAMDYTLSSLDDIDYDSIRKFHLSSWRDLGKAIQSNRKQHWGIRRKPKTGLFKQLKLSSNREFAHDDEWEEQSSDDRSWVENLESSNTDKYKRGKQLLQFDKSHRPAFYGIWPKKSHVVGARHPLRKDPDLDYDIDSDEEWEEEEPGESLSDCDKDDEEQSLEEGCSKDGEEEESEDGFFVPDGYLSENEGVQVDRMETDLSDEETEGTPCSNQDSENEEFHTLLQHQKNMNNLIKQALHRNQPKIILNLMLENDNLLMSEDLTGASSKEKACLDALKMRHFPGWPAIEISVVNREADNQDACTSSCKTSNTVTSTVITIQDLDMAVLVSAIQSCNKGINKLVEALQRKFPTVSKSQLRNKVREISDFVDNRWQVKKEILDKLGISPEKGRGRIQSISKFFSKRCLPPSNKNININANENSPEPSKKTSSAMEGQEACSYAHP